MNEMTRKDLEQSYASKDTAELISLSKLDLAPLAREIIELEIYKRNKSSSDSELASKSSSNALSGQGDLATTMSRVCAQLIDLLIAISFLSLAGISQLGREVGLLLCLLYLLFADALFHGQSIGKLVVNIGVIVETTGQPCGYGRSMLRNIVFLLLNVVDWIFVFGLKRQRLGDKLAGTLVIKTMTRI